MNTILIIIKTEHPSLNGEGPSYIFSKKLLLASSKIYSILEDMLISANI